jgi:hypothetical protein
VYYDTGMYYASTDATWRSPLVTLDYGPSDLNRDKRPIKYKCEYCGTLQQIHDDDKNLSCIKCGAPLEDDDDE